MSGKNIKRYSLTDIENIVARGDVTPTRSDAPELELDEAFWRTARVVMPDDRPKASIHLRVDADVLDWFRAQGQGHLTRMNAVLKAYMRSHKSPN